MNGTARTDAGDRTPVRANLGNSWGPVTTVTTSATLMTLGLSAASWVFTVEQANGMDMGPATKLGSFVSFGSLWVVMMAAMMLPGATPAVGRYTHTSGRLRAVPLFLASYLAAWAVVGIVIYFSYRPHDTMAAGAAVIAAGIYDLTPLKKRCRRRCEETIRSGFQFGLCCIGSSIGLMVMLLALGVMNPAWMGTIAALVLAQRLLPAKAAFDLPVAIAIVGLGVLIVLLPSSVPGLMSSM